MLSLFGLFDPLGILARPAPFFPKDWMLDLLSLFF